MLTAWRGYRLRAAEKNWWQMRHIVDDDYMFSLSDGFKSGTVNRVLWSARGKQVFLSNQAQHQVIWLMSSASPAEGGLISETSCCAVCLGWRPAYPSVKAVSQPIKVAVSNSGPDIHSSHFVKDEFKSGDERWIELIGLKKIKQNCVMVQDLWWN